MLDTPIPSEAQTLPWDAAFQHDGAPSDISRAFRSLWDEISWNA